MARSNYQPWKGTDKDRGYQRRITRVTDTPQRFKRTLIGQFPTYDDALSPNPAVISAAHKEVLLRILDGEQLITQIRQNKQGFGLYLREPIK